MTTNARWTVVLAAIALAALWASGSITASAAVLQFQEDLSPTTTYQGTAVYIRSTSSPPAGSNSEGGALQVGRTATANDFIRSIVGFDVSSIPSGSTINSVTLTISPRLNDSTSLNQAFAINLYRMMNDNFAENTATWFRRDVADAATAWTTAGGDFNSTVLSSLSLNAQHWADGAANPPTAPASDVTFVFGSTTSWVAAAQAALNGNGVLNMIMVSPDAEAQSGRVVFQIASDDPITSATGSNRKTIQSQAPLLTIDYTVPEPSTLVLAGFAFIGFARRSIRRRK
jgi:hypothetical protein